MLPTSPSHTSQLTDSATFLSVLLIAIPLFFRALRCHFCYALYQRGSMKNYACPPLTATESNVYIFNEMVSFGESNRFSSYRLWQKKQDSGLGSIFSRSRLKIQTLCVNEEKNFR